MPIEKLSALLFVTDFVFRLLFTIWESYLYVNGEETDLITSQPAHVDWLTDIAFDKWQKERLGHTPIEQWLHENISAD